MTNEEALAIFEDNDTVIENPNYLFTEIGEAWDKAIEALKEQRPHGEWDYLKEHITEMRDADGELNQKQTCQFILNLMGVIEREGEAE